jgi:outer membrane receptor protein involved in Fe transport
VNEEHESFRQEAEAGVRRTMGRSVWRAAAGAAQDRLTSTTDGTPGRRSANARIHMTHDRARGERTIRWTGAVRADAVRGFAPFLSPRVGVTADVWPRRLTARISAGTSYRAPSFDELFWAPRASAAGNPNLRAERGADLEGGLEWSHSDGRTRVSLDAFVRKVDDLIQWVPGASGVWRPHNVGRVRIAGAESEGHLPLPSIGGVAVELSASATFLDARDRTGEPNVHDRYLVYRPRWSGSVGLLAEHGRWGEIETVWQGAGAVPVTRANTKSLDGAVVGDVHARVPLSGAVRLDCALTNVTDARVRDFRDYPLPGRSWRAGLTWHGGGR